MRNHGRQRGFGAGGFPGTLHLLCLAIFAAFCPGPLHADEVTDREYKVKAAFVYNFLKFVEGGRFALFPDQRDGQEPNLAIVIGVLGVPPSRAAFEEFRDKKLGDRPIHLHWYRGFAELADADGNTPQLHPNLDAIRRCHVLLVCPSERSFLERILPSVRNDGLLTVGDVPQFLESGGVINLLIEDKKVRFEVNLAAATRAHLTIRSSLLRLAVRTVEHDRLETLDDQEKPGGSSHP